MSGLLSQEWFRVADLHPQLRPQVQVHRQPSRGQDWYVLHNLATGRFHRLHAQAYELVGRLDGECSLDEVWRALVDQLGDAAPTQDEVLVILAQLADGDLLQAEYTPDMARLIDRARQRDDAQRRARVNPLSFRVPLWDPHLALQRCGGLAHALISRWMLLAWLVLVSSGLVAWVRHLPEWGAHAHQSLGQPALLLMMWLAYPVMKALHEAAHALALKRFGCTTHEMGVSFLLLLPLPYVDANDSLRLSNRWQRATIVAAGMAVELAVAAAAAWVWVLVEPGVVRDLALALMILGGASSLLFNGNPLMRYDGYHLLCDVLDVPNLGARSARQWQARLVGLAGRLWSIRQEQAREPSAAVAERMALLAYAPLAWVWRGVVAWVVVQWAHHWSPWLSWSLALWLCWSWLLKPAAQQAQHLVDAPSLSQVRGGLQAVLVSMAVLPVAALLWWPWAPILSAQGLLHLPEDSVLRAPHASTVATVLVRDGQAVQAGQPLLQLTSDDLLAQRQLLTARVAALEAERSAAWGTDVVRVQQAQEALQRDARELAQVEQRIASLVVRAPSDGRYVAAGLVNDQGRDVAQGDVLGRVLPTGSARVLLVIDDEDVGLWRNAIARQGPQAVDLKVVLADDRDQVYRAHLLRQAPAALERLPDPAMATSQGGWVQVDPDDAQGLKPLKPVYSVLVSLPDREIDRVGVRARVRLALPEQSVAAQLYFRLQQLLLTQFAHLV